MSIPPSFARRRDVPGVCGWDSLTPEAPTRPYAAPFRIPRMKELVFALATLLPLPDASAPPRFDVVLEGGRVVDGTGAPWFVADVGVRDGKIAAIGRLDGLPSARRIDARKLVVAPGFIDLLGWSEYFLLVDGRAASKITQGITTEVTGEGASIAPLNRPDGRRGEGVLHAMGRNAELAQPRRLLRRAGAPRHGDQRRDARGLGRRAGPRDRQAEPDRCDRRARVDEGDRRSGNAGGGAGRLLVAPVHPEHLLVDGGADRARRRFRRSTAVSTSPTSARNPAASTPRWRRSSRSRARRRSARRSGT